ncbi:MAG: methionyl-tRNA formyltransferase [Lachnospiraceae bacterium]|nr:methionyl-tRNA formyltransferase [Lachnospiraceae bacterium]
MRVVFMGTPDFAVETVNAIAEAGHEIVLVVTQPDKPKGRGKEIQFPPVKEWAVERSIPVFQPVKIRQPEAIATLKQYEADIFVVAAFGQILPKEILDMPPLGCVNVHASLLPKYRGAAPIQWAVINGDKVSGVTTMMMGVGLDDGDMLLKQEVELAEDETGGSLFDRLAQVGGELIVRTMEGLEAGTIIPEPQVEVEATHVGMIKKSFGQLDFSLEAVVLERRIRGLNPWPSAYTKLNNKTLKVWWARVEHTLPMEAAENMAEPGVICYADESGIWVSTKENYLVLEEIQLEGKKRMSAADFLRGRTLEMGTKLGE